MSGYEMISREVIDRTTMLSYLSQFYELFRKESVERDAAGMIQHRYNLSVSFIYIVYLAQSAAKTELKQYTKHRK